MKLCWICPTWNRPACLRNLIAQFLAQDDSQHELHLIICDDAGQYCYQFGTDPAGGHRWEIMPVGSPFATLPEKYNALLGMVPQSCEGIVIAEDDDLYHPLHSAACAAALQLGDVSKPSKVRSQYGGREQTEDAAGRFHASLAVRADFLRHIGGWPATARADFDQQFIARLATGRVVDPLTCRHNWRIGWRHFPPTYCFRWETTQHTHAQGVMRGPADEDWLERARAAAGPIAYVGKLHLA